MTILTAISDGKSIWLGSNYRAVISDTPLPGPHDPWLQKGNWAVGICGASVQLDILMMNAPIFEKISNDPYELADKIRDIFVAKNYFERGNGPHPDFGIYCILAHLSGQIWDLDESMALSPIPNDTIWARGSGMDYALGADYALRTFEKNISLEKRITLATKAAIHNDVYCPGEAHIFKFA